jgi:hypothetical protein
VAEGAASESRIDVLLTLEPDGDKGWKGNGYFSAGGLFSPHDEMAGLEEEALEFVGKLAASVLPGATVKGYNPEFFEPGRVSVGFRFGMAAPEPDGLGRTGMMAGRPAGGIAAALPTDVHLFNERRTSPVLVPGLLIQRVRLRVRTGELEVVQLPEPARTKNSAGEFVLRSESGDGWVTVERSLTLNAGTVAPQMWPELRLLLLNDADAATDALLFR